MNNKPYRLSSVDVPNKHILDYRWRERKTERLTFMFGQRLPCQSGYDHIRYTLVDPKDYDLLYHSNMTEEILLKKYEVVENNGTSPIVNKRFMDLLSELCPDDVQFFPVTIVNANDKVDPFENKDFYVLNICREIDALDFDKTEFALKDDKQPKSPSNVIYPEQAFYKTLDQIEPFGIARVLNGVDIILSHTVAEVLNKAKIKGLRLYPCP